MPKSNSFYNIDILILSVLNIEDCYGYDIIKKIKNISEGNLEIKEGTLYPIIYNLLEKGYISSYDMKVGKRYRVYYKIENSGKEYLYDIIEKFKKSMYGVFKVIEYGEGEINEKKKNQ